LWLSAVSRLFCPQLTPVTGTGTHHNRLPAQRLVNNASNYVTKKKRPRLIPEEKDKKKKGNIRLGRIRYCAPPKTTILIYFIQKS
jgi:hypothetical protein